MNHEGIKRLILSPHKVNQCVAERILVGQGYSIESAQYYIGMTRWAEVRKAKRELAKKSVQIRVAGRLIGETIGVYLLDLPESVYIGLIKTV